MSDAGLLSIRGLTVTMPAPGGPVTVVRDVDLALGAGDALALVGESGCGKTTTLLAVLGLLPRGAAITAGETWFQGRDLRAAAPDELRAVRGGKIGVIWQDPLAALDPVMRVGGQIAEVIRAHASVDRRAAARRAKDLMRLVELPDVERTFDAYPHELSGGQRQRVVIAAAIAADPALLLADEPTTALDVTVQDQVLALLGRLRSELGLALLLVTHDLAVVSETCDRVAIMYAGRIVESGTSTDVFDAPRHPYAAGLLAAAPDVDRPGVRPAGIAGAPPARVAEDHCAFAPRCPRADRVCATVLPVQASERGHQVACHHQLPARGEERRDPAGSHG
jgi:oligopeptide/dipeptide ABC transporter ATP-binding protein